MPATLLSRAPLFDSLTAALSFSLPSTVTPLSQLSHQPGLVDKLAGWFLTWAAWICAISRYIFILVGWCGGGIVRWWEANATTCSLPAGPSSLSTHPRTASLPTNELRIELRGKPLNSKIHETLLRTRRPYVRLTPPRPLTPPRAPLSSYSGLSSWG